MWLIVLQNKGLVDWIFLFCLNFFYRNDTTTLNNNWRVVEGKHDILGDSRKYPYQTMDGFSEFRGQGGVGGGGSLNWKSGNFELEILTGRGG